MVAINTNQNITIKFGIFADGSRTLVRFKELVPKSLEACLLQSAFLFRIPTIMACHER